MEQRSGRLTGIIGGISEAGRAVAAEKGAAVAIFDSRLDDTIAVLAEKAKVDGVVGGIAFFEADPMTPVSIEEAVKRAEAHFKRPIDIFKNVTNMEEPVIKPRNSR